jgi:hypothetical protein
MLYRDDGQCNYISLSNGVCLSSFLQYPAALKTSARFMPQQVDIAKDIPDAALIGNKMVDFKAAPGYFPTGSDPVKYAPAIAYTTAMLSWGLTQFDQGFKVDSSNVDGALEVRGSP